MESSLEFVEDKNISYGTIGESIEFPNEEKKVSSIQKISDLIID